MVEVFSRVKKTQLGVKVEDATEDALIRTLNELAEKAASLLLHDDAASWRANLPPCHEADMLRQWLKQAGFRVRSMPKTKFVKHQ